MSFDSIVSLKEKQIKNIGIFQQWDLVYLLTLDVRFRIQHLTTDRKDVPPYLKNVSVVNQQIIYL